MPPVLSLARRMYPSALRIDFQRTSERALDGIACVADEIELHVVRLFRAGDRHGACPDARFSRVFASGHADVPRSVREGGMAVIAECAATDVAGLGRQVGVVAEIDRYGIGTVRNAVFVVVVGRYRFGVEENVQPVARAGVGRSVEA